MWYSSLETMVSVLSSTSSCPSGSISAAGRGAAGALPGAALWRQRCSGCAGLGLAALSAGRVRRSAFRRP